MQSHSTGKDGLRAKRSRWRRSARGTEISYLNAKERYGDFGARFWTTYAAGGAAVARGGGEEQDGKELKLKVRPEGEICENAFGNSDPAILLFRGKGDVGVVL
ncbi:uncharacterized protein UDID_18374 [Ustilago sp. UG-2017a]|nr:uncharacterized protein UDID_18374 [Ustilago sp. UG-2017a]